MNWNKKTVKSAKNYFRVAEEALEENPTLKKIVLLNRIPRFDSMNMDPLQIKHQLSNLANHEYTKLHSKSQFRERIIIGKHNIENSAFSREQTYGKAGFGRFDGLHMVGKNGRTAFTNSLENILVDADIIKPKISNHPAGRNDDHPGCSQPT